ncbi:hypothetical protein AB0C00_29665, partial [Micromonospora carbonacea]
MSGVSRPVFARLYRRATDVMDRAGVGAHRSRTAAGLHGRGTDDLPPRRGARPGSPIRSPAPAGTADRR